VEDADVEDEEDDPVAAVEDDIDVVEVLTEDVAADELVLFVPPVLNSKYAAPDNATTIITMMITIPAVLAILLASINPNDFLGYNDWITS